jgi:hypothetical protein
MDENGIISLRIEGYRVVSYYCRKKYKGGGTALYVSNNMAQVRTLDWITANSIEKTVEVIGVDIVDMNCIIIMIYRSSNGLLDDLFNCFDCILDKIIDSGKGIIVMGDININILVKGSDYKQLLDRANIYNLTITIKEPTRVTDSSAAGIDQIRTNLPGYQYQVGVKHSLLSGHYAQEMKVYMKIRTGISYKEVRDPSDNNMMRLCTLLTNEAWEDVIGETDVNKIWGKCYATFNYLFNIA